MTDVDEIKSRLNITDEIGRRVSLKKAGRNFKGLCPFHNEKTPSFMVSSDRGTWHCFGCGKGGDIFAFVMEYEHIDFSEALEELATKAGVTVTRRMESSPEGKLKEKIFEVNHLASEFYHYLLTKHALGEKARQYLEKRNINEKAQKTFMLGYSPNSWDGLLKFLTKKGYDQALLEKAGLVLRSTKGKGWYDRFRGRVMFTLKDHRGNVVGFSGRILTPDGKEAKYINTSETPVYSKSNVLYGLDVTKDAISRANEAIIMEGELDLISSFQAGIGNVVAIKGSALTEGHVNLLRRFCERIIFSLDSDLAGDAAARRGIEIADRGGLDMKVAVMVGGKDPDDIAREHPSLLKKYIADAEPMYDYFISSAIRRYDTSSAFGKKKITDEIIPILGKIENSIVRSHYVKKLAAAVDVPEELIEERIDKREKPVQADHKQTREVLNRHQKLELLILALLLTGKTAEFFEDLKQSSDFSEFTYAPVRETLRRLRIFLAEKPVFLVKDFTDSLPPELLPTVDQSILWDLSDIAENEELMFKEWQKATTELSLAYFKERIDELTQKIRNVGSEEERGELQKQQQELVRKRLGIEKQS